MSESRMNQWLSRFYGHFTETIRRPFLVWPASTPLLFIFFAFLLGLFLVTRLLDSTIILTTTTTITVTNHIPELNCTTLNTTITCPTNNYPNSNREDLPRPSPAACPEYFRWIHEDLRPWAHTGITREMVDSGRATSDFRLVIVDGKAYFETYRKAFQTRDVFTHWGILQLLRKYPGQVPDLDLMFECDDRPAIASNYYNGSHVPVSLPIFRYCSVDDLAYIVFPDWSFWGWPEINIHPWNTLLEDLKEGNKRTRWMEREPHAYWKGNPNFIQPRQDVMKCNVTEHQDWNLRVYALDWQKETQEGYQNSDMASQCNHRFKIYIEGIGWSVSEKYILACDSLTLLVKPRYHDFFSRGLVPMHHYWPIKQDDKCKSLKFAVDWGNRNKQKAQAMGKAGSEFILRDLKMDYVYDYMLHLLTEYAKLLTFKPTIPENVTAMCSEKMGCPADGLVKKFMMESMVKGPADTSPCTIPPPFAASSLYGILSRKENSTKEVELWEKKYWDSQNH
ncbi:Glyco_transf_90 domain-containing protein [Cephalotus follicularis]|uniref:Glyco_transf_90 domain-containing protein n=1 Tax=Cephalotus follicularis TaxID=3775 RepID=A0A1Q3CIQ8_CEPFO|nr:Glyco_transf_90 domain-containing protein [Cephalotus follicularis]